MTQLDVFTMLEAGLCAYGQPRPGVERKCWGPATHAACWEIPDLCLDGTPNSRAGAGRIECCRDHADYYATAWVPRYPMETGSAWIEPLPVPAPAS